MSFDRYHFMSVMQREKYQVDKQEWE